jgi:hypothetical protein
MSYLGGSVILRTLEHSRTEQIKRTVSQLQSASLCTWIRFMTDFVCIIDDHVLGNDARWQNVLFYEFCYDWAAF